MVADPLSAPFSHYNRLKTKWHRDKRGWLREGHVHPTRAFWNLQQSLAPKPAATGPSYSCLSSLKYAHLFTPSRTPHMPQRVSTSDHVHSSRACPEVTTRPPLTSVSTPVSPSHMFLPIFRTPQPPTCLSCCVLKYFGQETIHTFKKKS